MTGHPRVYPEYKTTTWCTHNPPEELCPVCENIARDLGAKPLPEHDGPTTRVRIQLDATFVIPGERTLPDWAPTGVMCVGLQRLIDQGKIQGPITLEPGARVTLTQVDETRKARPRPPRRKLS